MPRRAAVVLLLALVAACTSMQERYQVRRSNISCEEANRYAYKSMQSLGYAVTEFRLASVGQKGGIKGTKTDDRGGVHNVNVSIECQPSEVVLSAAEEQFIKQDLTFTRGFYLSFTSLADHGAETAAYKNEQAGGTTSGGAKIEIRPQLGLESKLDFGEDLAGAGIMAVKIVIQNGSDRAYDLDPAAIELRGAEGSEKVAQIPLPEAAAKLARSAAAERGQGAPSPGAAELESLLRQRALTARKLKPGDKAEGFLYFPVGKYARARATLVDVESGEEEGFLVEF